MSTPSDTLESANVGVKRHADGSVDDTGRSRKRIRVPNDGNDGDVPIEISSDSSDDSEVPETGDHVSDSDSDNDEESSNKGRNDCDDDRHETIIDFCSRKGYVPQGMTIPASQGGAERMTGPAKAQLQAFLALPPLRELKINPGSKGIPFKLDGSRSRWLSLFTYVGGKVADEPCVKCAKGTARYAQCIVVPNAETEEAMRGCCASCIYSHHPADCSMYYGVASKGKATQTRPSSNQAASSGNDAGRTKDHSEAVPSQAPDIKGSSKQELETDLEKTNDRLRALKTERAESARTLEDLRAQLNQSLKPPIEFDIAHLDRQLVSAGGKAGLLLAEKLSLKRRREFLKYQLQSL